MTDAETRFWQKVDRTGGPDACWPWTAGRQKRGYGVFHPTKGTTVRAHRFALAASLGRPLTPGQEARHSCDNPPCCNPDHLSEGTRQNNVDDAVSRGRHIFGSRVPSARMTDASVMQFRERFAAGETLPALCEEVGLSLGAGSNIVNGRTWGHVGGPVRTERRRGRRPQHERSA